VERLVVEHSDGPVDVASDETADLPHDRVFGRLVLAVALAGVELRDAERWREPRSPGPGWSTSPGLTVIDAN
jgi:hypothetical protein